MDTMTASVPMSFAGFNLRGTIPRWAKGFDARRATAEEVTELEHLPAIIVLAAGGTRDLTNHRVTVEKLCKRLQTTQRPCKIVLSLAGAKRTRPEALVAVLRTLFLDVVSNVEISIGKEALQSNVYEALAKYMVEMDARHPDPLSSALEVQETRERLLNKDSGRLDARKVAQELGMKPGSLAKLIGKLRATVNKTPDASGLQELLRPYERILRLRAVMPQERFLAWLEAPNPHLDDLTPRSLINEGRAEVVADLVEDALTGQPT